MDSSQVVVSIDGILKDLLANVTCCLRLRYVHSFVMSSCRASVIIFASTIQANELISAFDYPFRFLLCTNKKYKVLNVGRRGTFGKIIFSDEYFGSGF